MPKFKGLGRTCLPLHSVFRQGRVRVQGRSLITADAQVPARSRRLGVTPGTHLWGGGIHLIVLSKTGGCQAGNAHSKCWDYKILQECWRGPTPWPLTEVTWCVLEVCFHRPQTSVHFTSYSRTNTISVCILESQK